MQRIKRIKGVLKIKHILVLKVVRDYYNDNFNPEVVKYIFGKECKLSDEEKGDANNIMVNLQDKVYISSF